MKKQLSLLIGSILCANAVLNSLGSVTMFSPHTDNIQKVFGISVAHAEEAAAVKYTCPMHPQIISDTPGKCPICGMDLVVAFAAGSAAADPNVVSLSPAGASVVGGHSIRDPELKFGYAVTGVAKRRRMLLNSGARRGDLRGPTSGARGPPVRAGSGPEETRRPPFDSARLDRARLSAGPA